MTNFQDYCGVYYMMGMCFEIQATRDQLTAAVPHVPAGYEILLVQDQGDYFQMHGGPLDGEEITFLRAETGQVTGVRAGDFELSRVVEENIPNLYIVERMPAPDFELTSEKELAFSALLQSVLEKADGSQIEYTLPYPKHEFIQYLMAQEHFIFHGSNKPDIDTFTPLRTSYELRDTSGRGNMQAVYGTQDGLWSMFFAIVDRPRLRGSIRNGVMHFHNRSGERLAVYNFSINQEQLAEKPWCEGTLYLLPRASFERLKLTERVVSNEWASQTPVKPLARLHLLPEDFPFLDRIGGHDDGELLRLGTLGKEIRSAALSARLTQDHFTLTLPLAVEQTLDDFCQLQRIFIPAASFKVTRSGEELVLEIDSMPPAFREVLKKEYSDFLSD